MANRFTINGTSYSAKPFTFGTILDLEDIGVKLEEIEAKPMRLLTAYIAICADVDFAAAKDLIEKHVVNGGDFGDILESMSREMDTSDFFRALSKNKEQEITASKKKKAEAVTD